MRTLRELAKKIRSAVETRCFEAHEASSLVREAQFAAGWASGEFFGVSFHLHWGWEGLKTVSRAEFACPGYGRVIITRPGAKRPPLARVAKTLLILAAFVDGQNPMPAIRRVWDEGWDVSFRPLPKKLPPKKRRKA